MVHYVAVTNIPSHLHASDLRSHFSLFVEEKLFKCFHYRHRPEKLSQLKHECNGMKTHRSKTTAAGRAGARSGETTATGRAGARSATERRGPQISTDMPNVCDLRSEKECVTKCCVIKMEKENCHDLFERYNGQQWTDMDGNYLDHICYLSTIPLKSHEQDDQSDQNNDTDAHNNTMDEDVFLAMPELQPPDLMPHGNVGTPTLMFLDSIQKCLLPKSIISKLGLKFPGTNGKRLYSNVSYKYDDVGSVYYTNAVFTKNKSLSHHNKLNDLTGSLSKTDSGPSTFPVIKSCPNSSVTKSKHKRDQSSTDVPSLAGSKKCDNFEFCSHADISQEQFSSSPDGVSKNGSSASELFSSTRKRLTGNLCKKESPNQSLFSVSVEQGTPSTATKSNLVNNQSSNTDNEHSSTFLKPIWVHEGPLSAKEEKRLRKKDNRQTKALMDEGIEEQLIQAGRRYRNDEDAEEWDRHDASEDDSSNQERNKERLYEDEIEKPWEKGGSGLVFYSDAIYWQAKEGDFDEQTTDDLDVDFSPYEGDGPGDKDIRDFLQVRQEKWFHDGSKKTDRFSLCLSKQLFQDLPLVPSPAEVRTQSVTTRNGVVSVGRFEKYTKGISCKLMEKLGWHEGLGLGASGTGIKQALHGTGQRPHCKKGLGFVAPKPVCYGPSVLKKARLLKLPNPHLILTAKDDTFVTDPKEALLQRSESTQLKHRQSISEETGKYTNPYFKLIRSKTTLKVLT